MIRIERRSRLEGYKSMIICEFSFYLQDPNTPEIAMQEVDIYGSIPTARGVQNHRLTIRKNLVTDRFEAYRNYLKPSWFTPEIAARTPYVVFDSPSFENVISYTNQQRRIYHGDKNPDQVCHHTPEQRDIHCDAERFARQMVCFICGKGYETLGETPDTRRLQGHLTRQHFLSGKSFKTAMNRAKKIQSKARRALELVK